MAEKIEYNEALIAGSGQTNPHTQFKALNPDVSMVILTWVTFFILLGILCKFAWRPILLALENREEMIRRAVDDANKAREELARIHQTRDQIITEAEGKAKEIVDESCRAAKEAAKIIAEKAKQETHVLLENARREINSEEERAKAWFARESADLAIAIAGKLMEENLDNEKNRKLVDKLLKEIL